MPLLDVTQEEVMKERKDKAFKVCLPAVVFFLCSKSAGHDHDHRRLGLDHISVTRGKSDTPASEHGRRGRGSQTWKTPQIYSQRSKAAGFQDVISSSWAQQKAAVGLNPGRDERTDALVLRTELH